MRRVRTMGTVFLAVTAVLTGMALRTYHYGRNPSVWHDESWTVLNVLHKDFAGLTGPLDDAPKTPQAAPPLFLWLEKAAVIAWGDSTMVLRLIPFLSSCLALLLFAPTAWKMLEPPAACVAVLLFACSDSLLWHACEAKPYSGDALMATVALALFVFSQKWRLERRLLTFAIFSPMALGFSYPACFVMTGVLLAFLVEVWQQRRLGTWLAYAGLCSSTGIALGLLIAGPIHAQQSPILHRYWQAVHDFPDWTHPWSVPLWTLLALDGVVHYAVKPVGEVLIAFVALGAIGLWKRGPKTLALLILAPIAATVPAALAKVYPLGGSRLHIFLAPAILLLVAAGAWPWIEWTRKRTCLGGALLLAGVLLPVGLAGTYAIHPWRRPDYARAASYVMEHRQADDLVMVDGSASSYYFRDLIVCGKTTHTNDPVVRDPVWVIGEGKTAQQRRSGARLEIPHDWLLTQEQEFLEATVYRATPAEVSPEATVKSSHPPTGF